MYILSQLLRLLLIVYPWFAVSRFIVRNTSFLYYLVVFGGFRRRKLLKQCIGVLTLLVLYVNFLSCHSFFFLPTNDVFICSYDIRRRIKGGMFCSMQKCRTFILKDIASNSPGVIKTIEKFSALLYLQPMFHVTNVSRNLYLHL